MQICDLIANYTILYLISVGYLCLIKGRVRYPPPNVKLFNLCGICYMP
jgi:hypothetical protein